MSGFRSALDADYQAMMRGEFSESFSVAGPAGTDPAVVSGIWDDTYQTVDPDTNAVIMSSKPRLSVFASDVPFELKQGYVVTRVKTGKTYKIKTPQTDGEGGVTLYF